MNRNARFALSYRRAPDRPWVDLDGSHRRHEAARILAEFRATEARIVPVSPVSPETIAWFAAGLPVPVTP